MAYDPNNIYFGAPAGSTEAQALEWWKTHNQTPPVSSSPPAPAPTFMPSQDTTNYGTPTAPIYAGGKVLVANTVSRGSTGDPTIDAYYENLDRTAPTEEEEAATRENVRKQYQAQIDAINSVYNDMFAQQNIEAAGREAQGRSVSVRSGLAGSDFATANSEKVRGLNKDIYNATAHKKETELANIWGEIDTETQRRNENAITESKNNSLLYIGNREKNLAAQEANVAAQKTANETKGKELISLLASKGQSWDNINSEDKTKLKTLTGLEDWELELYYNNAKPQAEQIDWKSEKLDDGSILLWGQDPTTGEIKQQKITTDIQPTEEWKEVDGIAYGVTTNADGTLSLRKLTSKQYAPKSIPNDTPQNIKQSFEQFIKEQESKNGMSYDLSIPSVKQELQDEYNLQNDIRSQIGNTYITDKNQAKQYIDQIIQLSPNATYKELYAFADTATSLNDSDINSYLLIKGFKKPEKNASTNEDDEINQAIKKKILERLNK